MVQAEGNGLRLKAKAFITQLICWLPALWDRL
jgi:hypothetical protein